MSANGDAAGYILHTRSIKKRHEGIVQVRAFLIFLPQIRVGGCHRHPRPPSEFEARHKLVKRNHKTKAKNSPVPIAGRRTGLQFSYLMAMCSEDRISSLPDHILCHILSFLPLKEAVRTSVISTKWRYLFASISTIEFDDSLLSGLTDRNVDSFKNFVDRLLKFPDQVSLDCFRLSDGISLNDEDHDFDVSGWICAALCRGVKEIDLFLDYFGCVLTVPAVLFTCHSLVTLKLNAECRKIDVPSDVCLGNLKTLQLRNTVVDGDSIHRLISNCHVLEDLAFIECHLMYASALNIKTPSLKRLVLDLDVVEYGDFNNVVVINAPNLEKADISIYLFGFSDRETSATHLIQGIIQGICTVRSLNLTINDLIFRTCRLPIFHNLIKFEYGVLGSNGRETWLVEFLHCAPNLNTLTLNFLVSQC
uniref:F-box domain-containing protein n=1 Tax=Gossypium raimondii TaxID=29730 RepID=A0A0D2PL54_GOSRA|nr:hypothetical protein B456_005G010600 [Gossypium raimondii]